MPRVQESDVSGFETELTSLCREREQLGVSANMLRVPVRYRAPASNEDIASAKAEREEAEAKHREATDEVVELIVRELLISPEGLSHEKILQAVDRAVKSQGSEGIARVRDFIMNGEHNNLLKLVIARLNERLREAGGNPEEVIDWTKISLQIAEAHQGVGHKIAAALLPCAKAGERAKGKQIAILELLKALEG